MFAPAAAALALLLLAPAGTQARLTRKTVPAQGRVASAKSLSALDRARVALAEVKRDPARRRFRHQWERAIGALERAARGRDAGPALLEAARARYALYRFSQVEADREAALRLAERARRAGAKEAQVFAGAVRKEMGEEEAPRKRQRLATARPRPAAAAGASRPSATRGTATPTATPDPDRDRDRDPDPRPPHPGPLPRGEREDGATTSHRPIRCWPRRWRAGRERRSPARPRILQRA